MTQDEIVDLLIASRNGNQQSLDVLIEGFKPMVSSISRGYFLVGGDGEDLLQEGMIGLYKAILSYKIDGPATFSTFAYLCILRQVQSAVRASLKKSSIGFNNYIPISNQGMIVIDENETGIYLISSELTPEESLLKKEEKRELGKVIKKILSDYEFVVLKLYLLGFSHADIASKTGKDIKAVSNAIARMRVKLQNFLGGENVSSAIS